MGGVAEKNQAPRHGGILAIFVGFFEGVVGKSVVCEWYFGGELWPYVW
jgi:hypothetical protein